MPLLQKRGAEVLVADYDAKTLEGQGRGANIVLKFESEEAAMQHYNSPEYGAVKQIRLDTTENGTVILAKGFVPQSA